MEMEIPNKHVSDGLVDFLHSHATVCSLCSMLKSVFIQRLIRLMFCRSLNYPTPVHHTTGTIKQSIEKLRT